MEDQGSGFHALSKQRLSQVWVRFTLPADIYRIPGFMKQVQIKLSNTHCSAHKSSFGVIQVQLNAMRKIRAEGLGKPVLSGY